MTTAYYEETAFTFISFDFHLADFLCNLDSSKEPRIFQTIAVLSSALRDGHTCIYLPSLADTPCTFDYKDISYTSFPSLTEWKSVLAASEIAGTPGDYKPLILDNDRLYFYRRWNDEQHVAEYLLSKATGSFPQELAAHKDAIEAFFAPGSDKINYQHLAALLSLANRCCIISGGPGTGKTTTVVKILALHCSIYARNLRIGLAAPTGKAAARLSHAIMQARAALPCDETIKNAIPTEAVTIHRMLAGISAYASGSVSDRATYLPYSIIVIDEASMIDLSLMARLIASLHPNCKLILLGDKDQLSSVEAGSVLGDICDSGKEHSFTPEYCESLRHFIPSLPSPDIQEHLFANSIVTLKKSYRFDSSSAIGRFSSAINNGDSALAMSILNERTQTECVFRPLTTETDFFTHLDTVVREQYKPLQKAEDPDALFACLDKFKILCAVRDGSFGVVPVNAHIASKLSPGHASQAGAYHGLPVLITTNNYKLRVFNGDTGVFVRSKSNAQQLSIAFRNQDLTTSYKQPWQIRAFETAYAMTIHKSQGSEFDSVLIILPPKMSPLLTRELLYTAVTRAKKRVEIWSTPQVLDSCIKARIERSSGLREKLWTDYQHPIT